MNSFPSTYNDQELLGTNVQPRLSNPDPVEEKKLFISLPCSRKETLLHNCDFLFHSTYTIM